MPEARMIVGLAGVLGLLLGSFLNVCAYRWPQDESVVRPRSTCPGCKRLIAWYDNVPILSWLWLRGRCRTCQERISIQYPLVELGTGLIWAGSVASFGLTWEAARGAVFLTVLFGIALSDARTYIIPDEFSLGGTAIGLGAAFLPGGLTWVEALVGAGVGFFLLWGVAIAGKFAFRKDAMGGGDIKMMALLGSFLGWQGVLLTLFLGSLVGSFVFGPISWKTGKLVPFGIFLALGGAVTFVWGQALIAWYMGTVLGVAG